MISLYSKVMKIQNKFHFLFIVMALLLLPMLVHAGVTCKPQPMGTVNVIWSSDPIQYDFTKSQSQMDRIDNDTKNPYGRNVKTHVGGLMQGGISIKSKTQVATLTYPRSREICQWVGSMDVAIHINPKILISRDHKPGSCKHNAILEHEMKHVFVDREIVKRYIPLFKQAIEIAVRKVGIVGPKKQSDQSLYQKKINDYIETEFKKISDKMYADRSAQQTKVDTLEEYERVAAKCR